MADVLQSSELNVQHWSAVLSVETRRRQTFGMGLTGSFTKSQMASRRNERVQSSANMPFMRITDLSKSAGDTVHTQMRHILKGKPTMGGRNLEGQGRDLNYVNRSFRIDQTRHAARRGNTMSQKRTVHNLREDAHDELADYFARFNDQKNLVHVAGGRGTQDSDDWIVPLEDDADFDEIMINPLMPPTRNRMFYGGDATEPSEIDSGDYVSLDAFDDLRTAIADMAFPPTPIKLDGDGTGGSNPFYCAYLGPRNWRYLKAKVGENSMRNLVAAAYARKSAFPMHPLFMAEMGEMFMWEGFLFKRMDYSIRWGPADGIRHYADDGSTIRADSHADSTLGANVWVERAIVLGGQALAICEGRHPETGISFFWNEEWHDHRDKLEIAAGQIEGSGKFTFIGSDNELTDKGVIAMDCYAPPPKTTQGQSLISTLAG